MLDVCFLADRARSTAKSGRRQPLLGRPQSPLAILLQLALHDLNHYCRGAINPSRACWISWNFCTFPDPVSGNAVLAK